MRKLITILFALLAIVGVLGVRFSMEACAPWTEAFGERTAVLGQLIRDIDAGVSSRYVGWMGLPEDPKQIQAAFQRAQTRSEEMRQALNP